MYARAGGKTRGWRRTPPTVARERQKHSLSLSLSPSQQPLLALVSIQSKTPHLLRSRTLSLLITGSYSVAAMKQKVCVSKWDD